ncbi:MAG: EAL domain-containing protein [Hyphomonadaceae bacterium]|nr:EAL domain-containing protein [Hyphomonadaceae bacterium]
MMIVPDTGSETAARRATPASASLLEAAIERGGLHPFFHAKVSMTTRRIVGAEALARIATPQMGFASPAAYVELAERNQRIDALTYAMARAVAKHAVAFEGLPCSINISPISLERTEFADLMEGAINEAGLDCAQFVLEVTESRAIEFGVHAFETMTALRSKGFGLAIDDFGAGTSNIDRLRNFPFTEVKIDPAFTRLAMEEAFAKAALVSCVRLAREHGLKVVAEGVETQEMWDFMTWLKVDEAQGFLLSKPMQPADFRDLLKRD